MQTRTNGWSRRLIETILSVSREILEWAMASSNSLLLFIIIVAPHIGQRVDLFLLVIKILSGDARRCAPFILT
jgi:hypothetical protein